MVYRCLNPRNIMIDHNYMIKLIDFKHAIRTRHRDFKIVQDINTLHVSDYAKSYLAPEVLNS